MNARHRSASLFLVGCLSWLCSFAGCEVGEVGEVGGSANGGAGGAQGTASNSATTRPTAGAGGATPYAIRFYGFGQDDLDRVKIRVDTPSNELPGPPVDVGASDFTIEFWLRAEAAENLAPAVSCGNNLAWRDGNVVVDRDRFNQDRKFGLSIAGGRLVFGVSGQGSGDLTICGNKAVLDDVWHHVAASRRRSDGHLWLFVDGQLQAEADGPDGDISYPDNGVPSNDCAGPCDRSDPFLILGAEKHGLGSQHASFSGTLDELRVSRRLRYEADFVPPDGPFQTDAETVALYHFDEGFGDVAKDSSGAPGGPSDGFVSIGGDQVGPEFVTDTPF